MYEDWYQNKHLKLEIYYKVLQILAKEYSMKKVRQLLV